MTLVLLGLDPLAEKPVIDAVIVRDNHHLSRLLTGGESPDSRTLKGYPATILAIQLGYDQAAILLINSGANINASGSLDRSPLVWSVISERDHIFRLLLQKKALLDTPDDLGRTALMYAAELGLSGYVEELLIAGAKVDHRDLVGKSAADLAEIAGFSRLTQVIKTFE